MANNPAFWNQMLMRSDSISDLDPNAPDTIEQVRAQLSTITEQFDRVFDPADHFEEYVAVALCQALQRALTPKTEKPACQVSVRNTQGNSAPRPSAEPARDETATVSSNHTPIQPKPRPQARPKKRSGKRK